LVIGTINENHAINDFGIVEPTPESETPAINTKVRLFDKIMALNYRRDTKLRANRKFSISQENIHADIAVCVNVAYALVRRILDKAEPKLIMVFDKIHDEPFTWGDPYSPLMPSESESRCLDLLCAKAINEADAMGSNRPLLTRLTQTDLYKGCPKEVRALLEAALPFPSLFSLARRPYMMLAQDQRMGWENYQAFLHTLRAVCQRMQLRKDLYDRNIKMPMQRFEAIKRLLAGIFEVYSRVLVIRVDLKYQPQHVRGVSFEQHQQHIRQVCNAAQLGRHQFKGCLGYAVRMEDAPESGLHSHWAFFFHGGQHHRDLTITRQICDWWCSAVTQGTGAAWNVNAHWHEQINAGKAKPEDCVLGMIERRDEDKVLKMVNVMDYLCHAGQDVLYKPSKNARTFLVKECG
jgi:hypothetical protein